ncbi:MAG: hypothetical protein V5A68_02605 [Candidatus Thermoplasmatota archaeon]
MFYCKKSWCIHPIAFIIVLFLLFSSFLPVYVSADQNTGEKIEFSVSEHDPVLLIHGYLDCYWTPWWNKLSTYLVKEGYNRENIHIIDLGDNPFKNVDSPEIYAEILKKEIVNISNSGDTKVDIIAHSMGGLTARWAIEKLNCSCMVDDLVTLGTPHQGSYVAYFVFNTPGGKDMIPVSEFLLDLNDGDLSAGVEYTAVWGRLDEFVIPHRYARISGEELNSVEKARNLCVGFYEHVQLVANKNVFNKYKNFLD